MPWYGDYAMESWANDNNAESWKTVMNNDYTITLEDMPGWEKYQIVEVPTTGIKSIMAATKATANLVVIGKNLQISIPGIAAGATAKVAIFDMQGNQVVIRAINGANASINLNGIAAGQYIVKVQGKGFAQNGKILVK
jgi:mannan endo-1,4-beta-mannosidase